MVVGAGSLRSATKVERGSKTALIPDVPLSVPVTIGATISRQSQQLMGLLFKRVRPYLRVSIMIQS